MYINCHTYYSFRYGTLSVEELVSLAAEYRVASLAITDINNTSGIFDFVKACQEYNIKPVVGVEFRNADELCHIALAKNNKGFEQINRYLSHHLLASKPFSSEAPPLSEVFFIYPFNYSGELKANEFIGVPSTALGKIQQLQRIPKDKMVLHQPVTFANKTGYNLHRLLRSIDHNTLLSKLHPTQQSHPFATFVAPDQLVCTYSKYRHVIVNTDNLLNSCSFSFEYSTSKNKLTFTGSREGDKSLLAKLTEEGLKQRYLPKNKDAISRARKEIDIIDQMGFSSYFLITWDMIRYAQSRGYHHVGRGSGANSIVAYCLELTDVDPIELDLYFERFINMYRKSPPDFDIDFSWDQRDDVIDYMFKRYGSDHVALLATINRFKGKSTLRELGKVFGLPPTEIDNLIAYPDRYNDHICTLIKRYGALMQDFPNHLSIHAGGVLISEEPIYQYTPLNPMPKGFPISQFDMYIAEDIGFAKFDILSQRGLGHIKDAADLILHNKHRYVDVHAVQDFLKDPKIKQQLASCETLGCFYIESPAMRQLLTKLRCSDYLTLVAASSIIRPGVAKSGMMKEFIKRFHHPNDFQYIHPLMKELMEETYGIMVYQEDVIKVAHHFAGLSLGEADVLRRGMSGKLRSKEEIIKIKSKFINNCRERGYPDTITLEVWRQIESFSGYSFSKAHSASFAIESYQSLYLKTYFPHEFMVAVINNFGGFYRTEIYVHEARRAGATIEAPCINRSLYLTTIHEETVYLGFIHLKSLEKNIALQIAHERNQYGQFATFDDFMQRITITKEQLIILVRINAFREMGISKKELLWKVYLLFSEKPKAAATPSLFSVSDTQMEYTLPQLVHNSVEDAYDQMELIGFPLCSPFTLAKHQFKGITLAQDMLKQLNKQITMLGYYVCIKHVRTVKRDHMNFGCFIDEAGSFFDTVHFPNELRKFPFKGIGIYLIKGKIVEDFGSPMLEVNDMEKIPFKMDPRAGR